MSASLRLKALDSFHCVGSDCSLTCCRAWDVNVEAEKLAMWNALDPGPFKEMLLAAVEVKVSAGRESILLGKDADRKCVLLDEAGLCNIHKQSEQMLPAVCRDYPRMSGWSGARKLVSAKMSCPEVVRLVITADTLGQFEITENVMANVVMGGDFLVRVGLILEEFVKQVLAERRFPLAVRITGIAEVLIHLTLKAQQGSVGLHEVQRLCTKPKQRLYELNQKLGSGRLKPKGLVGGRFWKLVCSFLGAMDAEAYFDPLIVGSDFVRRAIEAQTDADFEALYAEVLNYREKAEFDLSESSRLYGEKYLSVKFINSGFPVSPIEGNFIASFLFCVYPYALFQLCLWLTAAHKGKVNDEDIRLTISRVERLLDHNDRIYKFLDQSEAAMRLDLYYQCLADL